MSFLLILLLATYFSRNVRLYISEKTLRLAQRHVSQTKSSFECFLVGSISVDSGKYELKKVSHTLNTEPLIPESSLLMYQGLQTKRESNGQAFLTMIFCLPGSSFCSSLLQFVNNYLRVPIGQVSFKTYLLSNSRTSIDIAATCLNL